MKKRIVQALSVFVIALAAFAGFSVGGNKQVAHAQSNDGTVGLEYELSWDGSYYELSGVGTATETDIVVASTYNGLPVKEIWYLPDGENITSITIPASIESIESHAFWDCESLKSFTVAEESEYFQAIDGNLYSKDGTTLVQYALGKTATEFTIPDGVTTLDDYAFAYANNLTKIIISDSVITLSNWSAVFGSCFNLREIEVGANNIAYKSLDGNLYSKDGTRLILYCPAQEGSAFTVPNGVSTVSKQAFARSNNLRSITLPQSVNSIGAQSFVGCYELESITVDENNTEFKSIDGNLYSKDGKTFLQYAVGKRAETFVVPNGVEAIGDSAFQSAMYLRDVTLPEGLLNVYDHAFNNCGITSIRIPDSVAVIAGDVFDYCSNLTSIVLGSGLMALEGDVFLGCENLAQVINYSNYITVEKGSTENGYVGYYATDVQNLGTPNGGSGGEEGGSGGEDGSGSEEGGSGGDASSGAFTYNGHSYQIYDGVCSSWEEASMYCRSLGGHLATITSAGENAALYAWITGLGFENAYFGLSDNTQEGDWRWVTGEPVSYTNWHAGEPNRESAQEDYGMFYFKFRDGTWNDGSFGGSVGDSKTFICEWEDLSGEEPSEPTEEYSIAVLSTEKSLTIEKGGSLKLGFGYLYNETGLLEGGWRQMAIAVSDPTVISLGNYEETDYGYAIEVRGLKEGVSHLTVTDSFSGLSTIVTLTVQNLFNRSYSYQMNDVPSFSPNNSLENTIQTNFYNLNGMYVNGYSCVKDGSKYKISFNVFNSKYHMGAVDIYDKDGNWLSCEEISKFTSITSLWETGSQAFELVSDIINKRLLTYEQASYAKKTEVAFEVPEGGYFTISNNIKASPGMFLYNFSEMLFEGITNLLSKGDNDEAREVFSDSILKEIKNKPKVKKLFLDCFNNSVEDEIKDLGKNLANKSVEKGCVGVIDLFKDLLDSMEISWAHLFESATGIAQSMFEAVSGPAGVALKGCFALNEKGDKYLRLIHLVGALDEPYIGVYSKVDEGFITQNGVVVNTNGNMDAEAVLQIFKISNDDSLTAYLDGDGLQDYQMYNISFVKNDQTVQPSGKVQVQIPVPTGMAGNTCKVYRKEEDGSWTMLNATVQGNYLVFETEHFSLYGIVGEIASLSVQSLPDRLIYEVGDVLNPEGLVLSLNGEEITEGYTCEQKVLHTVGEQKITVKYGLTTAEFSVIVTEKSTIPPSQPSVTPTELPSTDGAESSDSASADSGADEKKGGCGGCSSTTTALSVAGLSLLLAGGYAIVKKRKE